jgi:hypothetical protein
MSMSAKQIFYKVKKHLLRQGKQSLTRVGGSCLYRSDDGVMSCAVGCLMTDDMYSPDFEGFGVAELEDDVMTPIIGVHKASREYKLGLLEALQEVHDNYSPYGWADALDAVQERYNIT